MKGEYIREKIFLQLNQGSGFHICWVNSQKIILHLHFLFLAFKIVSLHCVSESMHGCTDRGMGDGGARSKRLIF